VKCWGWNDFGQLGDGTTLSRKTPSFVEGLKAGVRWISAGSAHTCAVFSAGGAVCWGGNNVAQLGDGTQGTPRFFPAAVAGLTEPILQVSAGDGHTCALASSGRVKCWGNNIFGALGDGKLGYEADQGPVEWSREPVDVVGLDRDIIAISAGLNMSCAMDAGYDVACWGSNACGQLGDGTTTDRNTPVPVAGL
jgi:alpha-tubulin suppressor-like RCC1 family protein